MHTDDVFKIMDSKVSVAEHIKFSKKSTPQLAYQSMVCSQRPSSHRYFTLALSDVPPRFSGRGCNTSASVTVTVAVTVGTM